MAKNFFDHLSHVFETPLSNPVLIFALILFIILLSPILLRWIKVPGIIGLILSGVAIGPHGLNLLEKNSAVDLFSTIGLLYIMFIAGLELDMNEFRKTRHKSVLFGLFTFAIPIAIGYPVCYYILEYDMLASIMISSMFATHTLVAYPVVNSYGISKNEAVAITIGGTILTDTAVLIILAVIIGASQGQLDRQFWMTLGVSFAIFLLIMFGIIPRVAKWFFQKVEGEKTAHYIFVLSVVFFAAFLAEIAGLEHIIGAFVAGLALNKLIPHSSALMNRIEFIGNAIFIPFFLISVGMIVDVSVLLNGPAALFIAATLTIVAIFSKWIAAWFTQLVFGYTPSQRQVIFGLSSAHAAATLAVIMVGFRYEIIDENVLNGTIVLILITCIVASLATESASKKVVLAGDQDEVTNEKNIAREEQLMLPIANLNNMESLLDFATLIKSNYSPHPITVLTVVPSNDMAEQNLQRARKNLDSTAKYASGSETEVNMMATIDHNVANGISRAAREIGADGILLGWPSKPGIIEKMVGEKTESILNQTDTNLFMCHLDKPMVTQKRILAFCPPLSESELGFDYCMEKVLLLSQELTIPILYVCDERTQHAIAEYIKRNKNSTRVLFSDYDEWDNLSGLRKFVKENDIIVFFSARQGEMSYRHSFDGIPKKLGKVYAQYNRILVFPSRRAGYSLDEYEDVATAPLLQRIGRGIGNMFTKD
ncbi:cation:proton antiporter [Parapedobacter sp. ISTM3]|uniref:Kef-type K+ transport system, membrane component KefB n=1 Tax=Parapedobacter luteus TaxID=623280 RepID=A0A1T5AZV8_9SPHI|nr:MULTISPECIES: cation:proton antiporter [Parapedobacter]MBK1440404.1 cation:proton antiporter [Parapedobacter sp. ISTM3]SKB40505.1 Kef-type K+ transport system, membrane component KefB [Parapedobacter luteus]